MLRTMINLGLLAFALATPNPARAADTTGAGSTFVFPILSKWSAEYGARTGNK